MMFADLPAILSLWPDLSGARATLINVSENHTFRLDLPDGQRFILRVHRPAYHSRAAIESELAWLRALRADTGLQIPRPIASRAGQMVIEAPFTAPHDRRHMVLFAFEDGTEPQPEQDLAPLFSRLGTLSAICHAHARRWTPPPGFTRLRWSAEAILDPGAIWGDWRAGPGVSGDIRAILDRLDTMLRADLMRYGVGPSRFGLIHADMRLANLLIDGDTVRLIDFDDCGFCWYGYDFAAAISFYEDDPQLPALRDAWVEGYRHEGVLAAADEAALGTMVMLRRMALLAWMGTHGDVDIAQTLSPHYAQGSAMLAERYMSGRLFSP